MKIAVCDDIPVVLDEIKQQMHELGYNKNVDYYSCIETLYEEINNGEQYDAILMDIDWKKEKTGIDFAEELQSLCPNAQIIFITAYTMAYVEDIFFKNSNLSGFLTKPLKTEQLKKSLEKVNCRRKRTEGKLLIRHKGSLYAILYEDIIHLESQLHKTYIVTKNNIYECTEKLDLIKERLDERFLTCHKSYVVNMDFVQELNSGVITLINDKTIPISKNRFSHVKECFFNYMFDKI